MFHSSPLVPIILVTALGRGDAKCCHFSQSAPGAPNAGYIKSTQNIQCWILPLWILTSTVSCQGIKESGVLNECERGVKRHHPSQANLYQIFTRKDYRKQWLDYACPEYMIFDPRTCECAETQRPTEIQGQVTQRAPSKGQSLRPQSSRRELPQSTQYSDKTMQTVSKGNNNWSRGRDGSPQPKTWGGDSKEEAGWQREDNRQDNKQDDRQDNRQDDRQDDMGKGDSWQRAQGQVQERNYPKEDSLSDVDAREDNGRESNAGWGKQERNSAGKQGSRVSQDNSWDKKESAAEKGSGGRGKQDVTQSKQNGRSSRRPDSDQDRDNEVNAGSPSVNNGKQITGYDDAVKKQDGALKKQSPWSSDRTNVVTEPNGQRSSGGECHLHRPSSENPSHFERWADGKWIQEDCNWPFYTGLVWSQASCRCEWGPNRTHVTPVAGDSVPATCLMMLKITFDGGNIVDEGRHIWLNIKDKENAVVESDKTAVGGKCGSFRGSSIAVPYFKSNVLGSTFHIGFMFKLCPGDPDTDIPLLHNDCIESPDLPGIVIVYQAWKKRVVLSMRTMDSENLLSEFCTIGGTQNQWVKLDVRYGDSLLEVTANNELCVSSDRFAGPVATNNCPLTLLGEAFCGHLDEVVITRGCTQSHAVN
ncbi:hypothetical protein Btru_052728 [Bulinus truncatus]|nr:hypothetical protein Btru_052728 [Bulinus truncatus]